MSNLRRAWRGVDAVFEAICLVILLAMLVVVLWQISSRQFLGDTPTWSEESARILLVWIGFLAAALGFREGAHIAITFIVDKFPSPVRRGIGRLVQALTVLFGLYLVVQGAQFVVDARHATLPGTGLSRSVPYLVMPVAGAMIIFYTILQVFGVSTERYTDSGDLEID